MSGVFKSISKVFKAIVKSPIFKIIAVAAAVYFTAGMAMAAFPAVGATAAVGSVGFGASAEVLALGSVGVEAGSLAGASLAVGEEAAAIATGVGESVSGAALASPVGAAGESLAGTALVDTALETSSSLLPDAATNAAEPLLKDATFQQAVGNPTVDVAKVGADAASQATGSAQTAINQTMGLPSTTITPSVTPDPSTIWGQIKDLGSDALKWFDAKPPTVQKMLMQGGIEGIKMGFQAYAAGAAADEKERLAKETRNRIGTPADLSKVYGRPDYKTPGIITSALGS